MIRWKVVFGLLPVVIFAGCQAVDTPAALTSAFEKAGANKSELSKVLAHYSAQKKDSLKYKAACFLIRNLNGKFYFEGELLSQYMEYPKLTLRDIDHGEYIINSFKEAYGNFDKAQLQSKYDLNEVTAAQLISNIDAAFKAWQEQPWNRSYSFSQFCNYVLPFRINDEVPCYERDMIYNRIKKILDSVPGKKTDAVAACKAINDVLIKKGWILSNRTTFLPNYNAATLIKYNLGSCREMKDLGIYSMRAVGIPVTSDFVPHWANRSMGHEWNVVFDSKGKAIPFLAAEDSPGTPHRPGTKKGKVYRDLFVRNPLSLAALAGPNAVIPAFLRNSYIDDVTDEYAATSTVNAQLTFPVDQQKFAYLSVFDNKEWLPVAWSIIKGKTAAFGKVENDIVVLPTYYTAVGNYPAGDPIAIASDGSQTLLIPDTLKLLREMRCNRIFPILPQHYFTDIAKGGRFQVANKEDFSDAVEIYKFNVRALPGRNSIPVQNIGSFRFARFISDERSQCKIAELQFCSGGKKLNGKLLQSVSPEEFELVKAVTDGNQLTAYISWTNAGKVSFDFGHPVKIDLIRYTPKILMSEDNTIIKGLPYSLKYWQNGKWRLKETQIATDTVITFKNVPSNALYLITPDSTIREKRIFTYENGKQKWY